MHFLLSLRFDILIAFGYEAISLKEDESKTDIAELKGSILTRTHCKDFILCFVIQSYEGSGILPFKRRFSNLLR
jgi:hypothetical protein